MKVFIQQIHTRKLLTESLDWGEEEDAKDFISSVEAIEWILINKIRDAQVLIRLDWWAGPSLEEMLMKPDSVQ